MPIYKLPIDNTGGGGGGGNGVDTFIELLDTPVAYMADKVLITTTNSVIFQDFETFFSLNELEVVRAAGVPAGAPGVGEDLYVNLSASTLYYNDGGGNWVLFPLGTGVDTFVALTDTPPTIDADSVVIGNGTGDALIFSDFQTFFSSNELEVTLDDTAPVGAPGVGNDLFVDRSTDTIYYNDGGGNWVAIPTTTDTHFANANLTFDGSHTHTLGNNTVLVNDATNVRWQLVGGTSATAELSITNAGTGPHGYYAEPAGLRLESTTIWLDPPAAGAAPQLRFKEAASNGDNYVAFRAATALAGNTTYVWPTQDGSPNFFLQTNGSGTLTWAAAGAGVDTFVELTDTPPTITADAVVVGNGTGTALIFVDLATFFSANEVEVTLADVSPPGAPGVGNDLYVDRNSEVLYYNDGAGSWVPFPAVSDTNLANADLTWTQNRTAHNLAGFDLSVTGATTSSVTIGNTAGGRVIANASLAQLTAGSADVSLTPAGWEMTAPYSGIMAWTAAPSELRFYNGAETFYVGFKAGAVSGNQIWTLPLADGTTGQVLQTNGSGVLSWTNQTPAGEADRNWSEDDIPLTGNRSHALSGFSLEVVDGTGIDLMLQSGTFMVTTNNQAQGIFANSNGVTLTAATISLDPASSGTSPVLRFYEDDPGTNFVGFKAAAALAGNTTYTWPATDGSPSDFLQTNGSGTLTWAAATGGGGAFYELVHDNAASWGAATVGYYTITITAATLSGAGITTPRIIYCAENDGSGNHDQVLPDRARITSGGNVEIRVTESPDGRYAGKIVVTGD